MPDPRSAVLRCLAFLVGVSLTQSWAALAALQGLLALQALRARVPMGAWLRRSLVALPLLLMAAPLAFTTPGEPLPGLPITRPGLEKVAVLSARTWLAVQAAALLALAVPLADLLAALERLGLPGVLGSVLRLGLRYVGLVGQEAGRMNRARAARSGEGAPGVASRARLAGAMAGHLFLRSLDRSERVYQAMAARGYDGRNLPLTRPLAPLRWPALVLEVAAVALVVGLAW